MWKRDGVIECSFIPCGKIKWCGYSGKQFGSSLKCFYKALHYCSLEVPYNPAIPHWGIYLRQENVHTKTCIWMLTTLFITEINPNAHHMSNKWLQDSYPRDSILFSNKQEWSPNYVLCHGWTLKTICHMKDHILHDSTYMKCPELANQWRQKTI